MTSFQWDAFLSHASEDKDAFVIPLVAELEKYGLNIWFDKFTLKVGDSLRRSIEFGLAASRFGIVILSPSFFAKNWPQSELDGLFARQMEGPDVILPVWHQITKQDLLKKVPMLVDKRAANSNDGIAAVAKELVRVLRPEALELDISRVDAHRMNARFLEQLREKHPALDFRVSVGPTPAPEALHSELPLSKGIVASAAQSGMRIDILAKDEKEYLKNPVTFSIRFKDTGVSKVAALLRTGKAQEFTSEEFSNVKTNLQIFAPFDAHVVGQKLLMGPSTHNAKTIPVRVTFRGDSETVQFSYMEMRMERGGTDEVSIVVRGQSIPFLLRMIVSQGRLDNVNVEIEPQIKGAEVHAVQKYARAMRAIRKSGVIEIFNLETDSVAFSVDCKLEGPTKEQEWRFRIIDDVVAITDYFGLSVRWPSTISEQDADLLVMLKGLIDGSPIGKGARFTSILKKTQGNATSLNSQPPSAPAAYVREDPIVFFGSPIKDQTLAVLMEEVRITDFEAVKQRFAHAVLGEEIEISYETDSPLLVKLWDKVRCCPIERPTSAGRPQVSGDATRE